MNLLFFTTFLPNLKKMGSEVASQGYIDAMKKAGHKVTVMGHLRAGDTIMDENVIPISERPVETKSAGLLAVSNWLLTSFSKGMPYSAAKYYCKAYIDKARSQLQVQPYDAIVIDHCQMAWLLTYLDVPLPVILITHNVEHKIYAAHATQSNRAIVSWIYGREARLIKEAEQSAANKATQIWTLADDDHSYYSKIVDKKKVSLMPLPTGADHQQLHSINSKHFDIGLIGSWKWKPNHDALSWFLKEVRPKIPEYYSIRIAGSGAEWLKDKYPNVEYLGFVDNPHTFLQQARVIAIPTLDGSGIQIKTLEAISSGSPIVSTLVGLRGIPSPPSTVHSADTPEEFSELIQSCLLATDSAQARSDAIKWSENRTQEFLKKTSDNLFQALLANAPAPT